MKMAEPPKRPPRLTRPRDGNKDRLAKCGDGVQSSEPSGDTGSVCAVESQHVCPEQSSGKVTDDTPNLHSSSSDVPTVTGAKESNLSSTKQESSAGLQISVVTDSLSQTSEPAQNCEVKSMVSDATHASAIAKSVDSSFRRSPKSRRAPPVPPPPVFTTANKQSVNSKSSETTDSVTVNTNCEQQHQTLTTSDNAVCPSSDSESQRKPLLQHQGQLGDIPPAHHTEHPDGKPALKPKPSCTVSRECRISCEIPAGALPGVGQTVGEHSETVLDSEKKSAECQTSVSSNVSEPVPQPVYAVVNKTTKRNTAAPKCDIEDRRSPTPGSDNMPTSSPTVARAKSMCVPVGTPPKKPPRTFAHTEYLKKQRIGTVHSCDYEEIGGSTSGSDSKQVKTDEETSNAKLLTNDKDILVNDSDKTDDRTADDLSSEAKIKRRQTNDKLPAPPRPPPPSFTDDKPSLSPTNRRSMISESTDDGLSHETVELRANSRGQKVNRHRAERSFSMLEHTDIRKKMAFFTKFRATSSKQGDDDDVYAVPSEVVHGAGRRNSCDKVLSSDLDGVHSDSQKDIICQTSSVSKSSGNDASSSLMADNEVDKKPPAGPNLKAQQLQVQTTRTKISNAYSILRLNETLDNEATAAAGDESECEPTVDEHQKRLQHVAMIREKTRVRVMKYVKEKAIEPNHLFDYAMSIGLQLDNDSSICLPYVAFHHPEQSCEKVNFVAKFCFPDAPIWRPVTIYEGETFSFVLTEANGDRRFGYCRRYLPPGKGNRLPEALCVISPVSDIVLYEQLLQTAEDRMRTVNASAAHEFLRTSYESTCPQPNQEIHVRTVGTEGRKSVTLRRSSENRPDNVSFQALLSHLSEATLVHVFGALLLERQIVFCAQQLGTLTSCIHSIVSLLYPFEWQHVFIPVLPSDMTDVLESPIPFVIGILASTYGQLLQRHNFTFGEMLVVDLDGGKLLNQYGDEERIIPRKLQKAIVTAIKDDTDSASMRDVTVTEAFLRFFVETCGHYTDYVCTQQDGLSVFERELFVKAVSSSSIKLFLEWFSSTQMFDVFITEELCGHNHAVFTSHIDEYREEMAEMATTLRQNVKLVGKRIKDFIVESGGKIKKKLQRNVYV